MGILKAESFSWRDADLLSGTAERMKGGSDPMMINGLALEEGYQAKQSVLISGEKVILRLMERSDSEELIRFFSSLPEHELHALRDEVQDEQSLLDWTEVLLLRRALALLALDNTSSLIVGIGTLQFLKGVHRHIADVTVVVSREARKLWLGSILIKELTVIAAELGLHFLQAEVPADNHLAIKAFRQLGFDYMCTIEGYFMGRNGQTQNVAMLLKRLRLEMEEDFFFQF